MNEKENNEKKTVKVLLFSTRKLESEGKLFLKEDVVKDAFFQNKRYCDFFISEDDKRRINDINKYLYVNYYAEKMSPLFEEYIDGGDGFWTALEKIKGANEGSVKLLDKIDNDKDDENGDYLLPKVIKESQDGTKQSFPYELDEKTVPTNELIKYFFVNKEDTRPKIKLDIDCDLKEYETGWRFKLYKLKLPANSCYSAYAVWSLAENIPHNEFEWYEALCQEILNQDSDKTIEEINLFLHDKDITSSAFCVRFYHVDNSTTEFSFLPDNVKLNVALFQHNDSIGKILSTTPSSDKEKEKLLNGAMKEIESGIYELSDCVARWHDGGEVEYMEKVKNSKMLVSSDVEKVRVEVNRLIKDLHNT